MKDSLRSKLQSITNNSPSSNHRKLIKDLKKEFKHKIKFMGMEGECTNHGLPFNCFMYALGVLDSAPIHRILYNNRDRDIKFGTEFVERLIEKEILKRRSEGDVIVYFKEGRARHAGIFRNEYVISKWGRGCLWKHRILEVPASYGDNYIFYKRPSSELIEEEFRVYAIF